MVVVAYNPFGKVVQHSVNMFFRNIVFCHVGRGCSSKIMGANKGYAENIFLDAFELVSLALFVLAFVAVQGATGGTIVANCTSKSVLVNGLAAAWRLENMVFFVPDQF